MHDDSLTNQTAQPTPVANDTDKSLNLWLIMGSIVLVVVVVISGAVGVGIWKGKQKEKTGATLTPTPTKIAEVTATEEVKVTSTTIAIQSPTPTSLHPDWNSTYLEGYDISISCPISFSVVTTPYSGTNYISEESCRNEAITNLLKDKLSCTKTKSTLQYSFKNTVSGSPYIGFFGATNNYSADFTDSTPAEILTVNVGGRAYNIPVYTSPVEDIMVGSFPIQTGNASPWKSVNMHFNYSSESEKTTILDILSTIK